MKTVQLIFLVCLLGLVSLGCKGKDAQLVGNWDGKLQVSGRDVPGGPNAKFTLNLKGDKTFTLSQPGADSAGTWSLESSSVDLKIEKIKGETVSQFIEEGRKTLAPFMKTEAQKKQFEDAVADLSKPIRCTVSGDMKTITMAGKTGMAGTLIFTKTA